MLALSLALAASQTGSTALLQPSAKWAIDYADDQCFLSRKYGGEADGVTLGLGLMPSVSGAEMFLIEPAIKDEGGRSVSGAIEIGGSKDRTAVSGVSVKLKEGGRITRFRVAGGLLDQIRASDEVAITVEERRYRLHLNSMPAAFAAADACKTDLMKSWGLDPKRMTDVQIPAEPIGSPASWVSPNDYPKEARRNREMGRVKVRLDIDDAGKIAGCHVVMSSGSKSLDETTCERAGSRARFRPARDASGKAIPTIRIMTFMWLIPD